MAYFTKEVSLRKMVDHIYGRVNIIERKDRPHMFIKELELYLDFLNNKVKSIKDNAKESAKLETFATALEQGIEYYEDLFSEYSHHAEVFFNDIFVALGKKRDKLKQITERLHSGWAVV
jgi:hypothetical protein